MPTGRALAGRRLSRQAFFLLFPCQTGTSIRKTNVFMSILIILEKHEKFAIIAKVYEWSVRPRSPRFSDNDQMNFQKPPHYNECLPLNQ